MVRISVPPPETTWKGLRRVSGRASLSTLIAEILEQALTVMEHNGAAD